MKSFFNPGVLLSLCVLGAAAPTASAQGQWSSWRGPQQDGHTTENDLPAEWNAKSVVWRTPLTGSGQSSPILFGERIFLTAAVEDGQQRIVMCLARSDGRVLWEKTAWTGEPEPSHQMNGWASASCVTDGQLVYAFFGKGGGLFCYSVDGDLRWHQPLGEFDSPWGTAACPILVDNLVIQNCDSDVNAYLVAFDRKSGEQIWKVKRENQRGWSTPIVISTNDRRELVLNGHSGVNAYDPSTGRHLWFCKSFSGRGTPTVTLAHGRLHVVSGLRGDVYTVTPGGTGDVTESHMVWHSPRQTARDLPSPIVVGHYMLVMDMRGAIITAYDSRDGRQVAKERVGKGASGQFCASPVAWNDTAFFVAESGETFAIRPGSTLTTVAVNTVNSQPGEIFRSSIAPSAGHVFLRSNRALYCIGQRAAP